MYTLYSRAGSGSAAVEALFAILAIPHEVKDVAKTAAGTAPDWYIAINPRGEIPSLQLPDNSIMTESAAMMIYLADSYPELVSPRHLAATRARNSCAG